MNPVTAAADFPQTIRWARRVAVLLDSAIRIPIIGKRIGLDPLLGLIPGGGDVVGLLLSSYIVGVALYHELPPALIGRMVLNLGIDTAVGSIPLLGDLFDFRWKANLRNIELLEKEYLRLLGDTITLAPSDYSVQEKQSPYGIFSPMR